MQSVSVFAMKFLLTEANILTGFQWKIRNGTVLLKEGLHFYGSDIEARKIHESWKVPINQLVGMQQLRSGSRSLIG